MISVTGMELTFILVLSTYPESYFCLSSQKQIIKLTSCIYGCQSAADFYHPELMPFRLAREGRVCVRSIDWSPQGLASHGG